MILWEKTHEVIYKRKIQRWLWQSWTSASAVERSSNNEANNNNNIINNALQYLDRRITQTWWHVAIMAQVRQAIGEHCSQSRGWKSFLLQEPVNNDQEDKSPWQPDSPGCQRGSQSHLQWRKFWFDEPTLGYKVTYSHFNAKPVAKM